MKNSQSSVKHPNVKRVPKKFQAKAKKQLRAAARKAAC